MLFFFHKKGSYISVATPTYFFVPRYPGNHEFPDHEKNDLDLDFLLLTSCFFIHEFPFFKIK